MRILKVRNVEEAYFYGTDLLRQIGVKQPSRVGDVIVAPHPVCTVYKRPWERVLFDVKRDANPFFHLFESLWMLAGRNDATWLDQFVSDFSERFAESNGLIYGTYGPRWRSIFHFDQLEEIIKRLKANPDDRRIVIQMWDALSDLLLGEDVKDLPCLAGDTLIWSPEKDLPIAKLAAKFEQGEIHRWPVYAVDSTSKTVQLAWCTNVWSSGFKKTLRLNFNDGSSIRITPEHILYKRGRNAGSAVEMQAKNLRPGDRVLATWRSYTPKGHEQLKRELGLNTAFSNMWCTHIEYAKLLWGPIPAGHVVHHDNEIKTDNREENLKVWPKSKHDSYHRLGDKNPMRRMSREQHELRAAKHSEALKASWAKLTPEQRKARAKGQPIPVDNHIIVSIDECNEEKVFDFTVPGFHTALIGTGVVAHNCNTHIYPRIIDGKLDLTVLCRSNDIIWGAYGANAVHFSILQEYLAGRIGVGIGKLYQFSNNWHAYVDVLDKVRPFKPGQIYIYWLDRKYDTVSPISMGEDWTQWDADLNKFMTWSANPDAVAPDYINTWFRNVATPLFVSHRLWKAKHRSTALEVLKHVPMCDWRLAAENWYERRM